MVLVGLISIVKHLFNRLLLLPIDVLEIPIHIFMGLSKAGLIIAGSTIGLSLTQVLHVLEIPKFIGHLLLKGLHIALLPASKTADLITG